LLNVRPQLSTGHLRLILYCCCCYADGYTCDFATCFAGDGSGSIIRDSVTIV